MIEPLLNSQVILTIIATLGSVLVAYITVKYKNAFVGKKEPKDRLDFIFEGYEQTIGDLRRDTRNKAIQIDHLERTINKLSIQLREARDNLQISKANERKLQGDIAEAHKTIQILKDDLARDEQHIAELEAQLQGIRKDMNT